MAWLDASIDAYQTIGVETGLSSPKYRPLVERARARGFEVRMIYVLLASADLQLERVRIRVGEGGHDVPPDKIVARRTRSFDQLAWFCSNIDRGWIFDNSTSEPKFLAEILSEGRVLRWNDLPDDLLAALKGAGVPVLHTLPDGD